jgi:hypothetical protein
VREILGVGDRISDAAASDVTSESLAAADVRHPVLAALGDTAGNLGQIRVERAWTLREVPGATTLMTLSSGRPALVELALGSGRVFVAASDVGRGWNSWPLHPTFVPFVVEAVRYLGNEPARRRDLVVASAGATEAQRPGVMARADGGRAAVNVDPRESRIETVTEAELLAGLERLPGAVDRRQLQSEAEEGQGLWRYLLFALLALLALEALMASRERPAVSGAGPSWTGGDAAVPGSEPPLPAGGPRA